ncbi:MAG: capsule assembly Wzi family protein [bacterium]|nr:capsule assembly Wzi family protein [bacterium]
MRFHQGLGLAVIFFLLVVSAPAAAHPLDVVAYDHWAYGALYRLAAAGAAPLWAASARPLARFEIARMVAKAQGRVTAGAVRLGPADAEALRALGDEFAEELRLLREGNPQSGGGTVWAGLAVSGWIAGDRPLRFERRQGSGVELSRLYLSGRAGDVAVQAGRDALWWGPGFRGAFVMSDNAGPVEALRLCLTGERLRVVKVVAPLAYPERYIYGFRVDWLARDDVRIGVSETMVGVGGLSLLYALNPLPLASLFRRPPVHNDNYNLALDIDWLVRPGLLLYTELYADDVVGVGSAFPHRLGGTAGALLLDPFRDGRTVLRLEHSRAANWIYGTRGQVADYVRAGRALGHWCAPDCELWSAELTRRLSAEASASVAYELVRKGEGRLGQTWSDPVDAWRRLYLSGIVETTHMVRLAYQWSSPRSLSQAVEIAWATVTNAGHVTGAARQDLYLRWEARLAF